jgi:hypothetical protein
MVRRCRDNLIKTGCTRLPKTLQDFGEICVRGSGLCCHRRDLAKMDPEDFGLKKLHLLPRLAGNCGASSSSNKIKLPAVLSRLCGQPGAAATVRVGLQLGQLPAAGGVAPGGAALDVDDVAGEADQDWGEGRAPCPAGGLPDGGGGGPARVVPGHSGGHWAIEIAGGGVRVKETVEGMT